MYMKKKLLIIFQFFKGNISSLYQLIDFVCVFYFNFYFRDLQNNNNDDTFHPLPPASFPLHSISSPPEVSPIQQVSFEIYITIYV